MALWRRPRGRCVRRWLGTGLGAGALALLATAGPTAPEAAATTPTRPPIYVTFLWHMHQPIYYPYEPATHSEGRGAYSFSIADTHRQRAGAYTTWPVDAVQSAMFAGLDHAGAQVSFSGSLMENLDAYEAAGWGFQGWKDRWRESNGWTTSLGNPRLDLLGFGYHHPLMPLLDEETSRRQIGAHRDAYLRAWNGNGAPQRTYSRGFFPPENAFAEWMIPAWWPRGSSGSSPTTFTSSGPARATPGTPAAT